MTSTHCFSSGLGSGGAILVFLVGRWLARRTRDTLRATLVKTTLAPSMTRLLLLAAYNGILFLIVILALALVGLPITDVLSASLVIVVILGIALQQQNDVPERVKQCFDAEGVTIPFPQRDVRVYAGGSAEPIGTNLLADNRAQNGALDSNNTVKE